MLAEKVYGLVRPTVPVRVTERFEAVVLESNQNAPRSLDVKVGTVSELKPVLVRRYTVEILLDASVRDVAETLEVIQRDSVGDVRRMLEVADNTKLLDASLVTLPVATPVRVIA